jgi:hypothetical protein
VRALLLAAVACLTAAAHVRGLAADPQFPFTDITAQSGLVFNHVNGAFGELLLPEVSWRWPRCLDVVKRWSG